jgi:hypothetical protein
MRAALEAGICSALAVACLAAAPVDTTSPDTSAEIPEGGGVAAAVAIGQSLAPPAPPAGPTPGAPSAPDEVPEATPATTTFTAAGVALDPMPCLRRKYGGSWAFCVEKPPGGRRAAPSPEAVARLLADRAVALAPDPRIEVAPARVGLTGLESYFWLAPPAPIRASARAGGAVVAAEARPVQFVWSFGDGAREVTSHPGVPWRPGRAGSIAHTYEADGAYELSLELVWEARWRVGGGGWVALGRFETTDVRAYPVRQVVPMLVPAR